MLVCQQQPTHAITTYPPTIHSEISYAPAMGLWGISYDQFQLLPRSQKTLLTRSKHPAGFMKDTFILARLSLYRSLQSLYRLSSTMGSLMISITTGSISHTRCNRAPPQQRRRIRDNGCVELRDPRYGPLQALFTSTFRTLSMLLNK